MKRRDKKSYSVCAMLIGLSMATVPAVAQEPLRGTNGRTNHPVLFVHGIVSNMWEWGMAGLAIL